MRLIFVLKIEEQINDSLAEGTNLQHVHVYGVRCDLNVERSCGSRNGMI